MNTANHQSLLQTICGARLTSVQFVLDYLILGFDEKGALTTLVWPEILDNHVPIKFGTNGYRNRLCELITETVTQAEISEDETITISFEGKSTLRIPLRSRTVPGERAIFTAPRHQLCVW